MDGTSGGPGPHSVVQQGDKARHQAHGFSAPFLFCHAFAQQKNSGRSLTFRCRKRFIQAGDERE